MKQLVLILVVFKSYTAKIDSFAVWYWWHWFHLQEGTGSSVKCGEWGGFMWWHVL